MPTTVDRRPYLVGSTYRFSPNGSDGTDALMIGDDIWDLTNATVTLYLRKPLPGANATYPGGGTTIERAATVTSAAGGLASYDSDPEDLDVPGWWSRSWVIVEGGIVQETEPIAFLVQEAP